MSWQSSLLNVFLRVFFKARIAGRPFADARAVLASSLNWLGMFAAPPPGVMRSQETLGGVKCRWVVAERSTSDARVIVYLHGGAFACGSPASHMDLAWRLSEASGAKVLLVDYRLTPEHVFPAALDDVVAVYRSLLGSGCRERAVAFAGDSAGANLALAGILKARDLEIPLPAACVCLSPWINLDRSSIAIRRSATGDPMLPIDVLVNAADAYAPGHDLRDPLISPLFADFRHCPPMLVYVGSNELLVDDANNLVQRARAAGVKVSYRVWKEQVHGFPVFAAFLPEGKQAIAGIASFLNTTWTLGRSHDSRITQNQTGEPMSQVAAEVAKLISTRLGLQGSQAVQPTDTLADTGVNSVDLLEIIYDLDQQYGTSIWPVVKERLQMSSSTVADLGAIVSDAVARAAGCLATEEHLAAGGNAAGGKVSLQGHQPGEEFVSPRSRRDSRLQSPEILEHAGELLFQGVKVASSQDAIVGPALKRFVQCTRDFDVGRFVKGMHQEWNLEGTHMLDLTCQHESLSIR